MNNELIINGVIYNWQEEFDVNLTLAYENDSWGEWHIIREFISNALDCVGMDISRVEIINHDGYIHIKDGGSGYSLVYAKRIGATSKKGDASTIGMFGEGVKMSLLTCIRKSIKVMLASMDWLIIPKMVEAEDQQVLFYDIYHTKQPISGSLVAIEATEVIADVINNLHNYFIYYSKDQCLSGNQTDGIYPLKNGLSRLYNKGVYVKDLQGLFSYSISIDKLNRDRDTISYSDIGYKIRDIWERVNSVELLKTFLQQAVKPSSERDRYIEFYASTYSNYPHIWAKAFIELYGENARLFTNDIAAREAETLGFLPINIEYNVSRILKHGGIRSDEDGLDDDYEFTFSQDLSHEERSVLYLLPLYANMAGLQVPETVKVFDEYRSHDDIPGIYNHRNNQIYIRRDVLTGDLEKALTIYLHEANHYETGSDDVSREFTDNLNNLLANMILRYAKDIGVDSELEVNAKGIVLPKEFSLSALNMIATIIIFGNEFIIIVADKTIRAMFHIQIEKSVLLNRKVIISKGRFVIPLPNELKAVIGQGKLLCKIK
ncbi:hypothetical protein [Ruminiclostridium cellobioparum]|uniref:hypothetical protein n=1 Tax=Ruminiclostridium cellobioparum TaxID=29355 RepID=UPI0028B1A06C|nr:hypothetical protein [Ruminiclostridium cellobioparum]